MNLLTRFSMRRKAREMRDYDAPRLAAQTLPIPGVRELRGLRYNAQGERHIVDVYAPEAACGPLPVLVDIHGGGLIYGDLDVNRCYCNHLAAQGWLVVGVEYTLAPRVTVFHQLREICAAIRFACRQAGRWGGTVQDGFCLVGDSAGGYLALYTAALAASPALREAFGLPQCVFPAPVRALGLVSPMTSTEGKHRLWEAELFGRGCRSKPFYRYNTPQALAALHALPPCFILTSEEDFILHHSLALADALKAEGQPHELFVQPKGPEGRPLGHVFPVCWPEYEESRAATGQMLAYLAGCLGAEA